MERIIFGHQKLSFTARKEDFRIQDSSRHKVALEKVNPQIKSGIEEIRDIFIKEAPDGDKITIQLDPKGKNACHCPNCDNTGKYFFGMRYKYKEPMVKEDKKYGSYNISGLTTEAIPSLKGYLREIISKKDI